MRVSAAKAHAELNWRPVFSTYLDGTADMVSAVRQASASARGSERSPETSLQLSHLRPFGQFSASSSEVSRVFSAGDPCRRGRLHRRAYPVRRRVNSSGCCWRAEELALIDQLLSHARRGTSGAIVIKGEAGIGKSALLDHAAYLVSDMRVLRISGVESEAEIAFGALHLLLHTEFEFIESLPELQAAALRAALGEAHRPSPPRTSGRLPRPTFRSAARRPPCLPPPAIRRSRLIDTPGTDRHRSSNPTTTSRPSSS
jgi:AAA ATPase domain